MSLDRASWSESKQFQLGQQLTGFWERDEWDFAERPLTHETIDASHKSRPPVLRFTCLSPALNIELKYACWQKFASGAWSPQLGHYGLFLQRTIAWLNQTAPHRASLLE